MAQNVLGLCILVLGATGIVSAFSFDWSERIENSRSTSSEEEWNYGNLIHPHLNYPHLRSHFYHRDPPYSQHRFEPLNYQIYFKKLLATRKPLILPEVKFHDDWSIFKKITTTHEMKSNENSILTADTYDYVPENAIGCNETGCIKKVHAENNKLDIINDLDSSSSSSSYFTAESESSTDTNKSIENETISSTQISVSSSVANFSTQKLDDSTGEDISVSTSNNETAFPTETSDDSVEEDGSSDTATSYPTTVSFKDGTDEVTVTSVTTEATRSTDKPYSPTEENLTTDLEISSDVSVANATIAEEKETGSNISSETEFNSSTEAQSTSSQSPDVESPASDSISSTTDEDSFVSSTTDGGSFVSSTTDKGSFVSSTHVNVGETTADISPTLSSKGSTSSKSQIATETVSQDHNIKISSIRTARLIVTTVFLVIALIAVAILAVFVFKAKRRAVEYDQLVLLP